jgi:hypothetical protein
MGEEPPTSCARNWVHVRKEIGPIASPDVIQWAPGLPKTRSGKIMRRILRKIAEDDFAQLGDTSTLADVWSAGMKRPWLLRSCRWQRRLASPDSWRHKLLPGRSRLTCRNLLPPHYISNRENGWHC